MGKFDEAYIKLGGALSRLQAHIDVRLTHLPEDERRLALHHLDMLITRTSYIHKLILEQIYDQSLSDRIAYKHINYFTYNNQILNGSANLPEFCVLAGKGIMGEQYFLNALKRLDKSIVENTRFFIDTDRKMLTVILPNENVFIDLLPTATE